MKYAIFAILMPQTKPGMPMQTQGEEMVSPLDPWVVGTFT